MTVPLPLPVRAFVVSILGVILATSLMTSADASKSDQRTSAQVVHTAR